MVGMQRWISVTFTPADKAHVHNTTSMKTEYSLHCAALTVPLGQRGQGGGDEGGGAAGRVCRGSQLWGTQRQDQFSREEYGTLCPFIAFTSNTVWLAASHAGMEQLQQPQCALVSWPAHAPCPPPASPPAPGSCPPAQLSRSRG